MREHVSFLSQSFIAKVTSQPPRNEGQLKAVTYKRTYSRWIEAEMRRETWAETCERVVNYNVGLYQGPATYDELVQEAQLFFRKMYNHEVLPAGRTMFIGGTAAGEKWPEAMFNCSFLNIECLEDFCEVFALLLCGCGVGFGVKKEQVSKLPRFNPDIVTAHETYSTVYPDVKEEVTRLLVGLAPGLATIKVGDSKEGWVEALRLYLNLHTKAEIKEIRFNYDLVRPARERLKTFGGRAAGPAGLEDMFRKLSKIIKDNDGVMDSVRAMDLCNLIAANVVVGGTRRSAQIALGSPGDHVFMDAKLDIYPDRKQNEDGTWDFGASDPNLDHRQMSNNTVAYMERPSKEEVLKIFKNIKSCGDPGFYNLANALKRRPNAQGLNPCFSAGTMVMTREGHFPIESLVGKTVEVWDGSNWRKINNFRVTAENQEVSRVTLSSGQDVVATPYHSFILEDGSRKELRDLEVGDRLMSHEELVHGDIIEPSAYLKGFLVGDGTHTSNRPLLHVYPPKYVCIDRLISSAEETNATSGRTNTVVAVKLRDESHGSRRMSGLTARSEELLEWTTTNKKALPIQDMLNWSIESKCEFIAGVMDADGTASDTSNGFLYQISSIHRQWLKDFQLLLRSIGVKSKLSAMHKEGERDWGEDRGGVYRSQASYRLTISQVASIKLSQAIKFERLVSFADKTLSYLNRDRSSVVMDVSPAGIADKVYCCTVEGTHSFSLTNGLVVGQCAEILLDDNGVCNLSTVVISSHIRDGKLNHLALVESFMLATRIGMRQTNVTLTMPHWDHVQKRDRLTGVSMTGFMDALDTVGLSYDDPTVIGYLSMWRSACNETADRYAFEMRIPRPLLVTAVKPEGTLSLLPTVSCGMHRGYAPYFLRRISIAAMDPLAQALLKMGVPSEGDATKHKSGRVKFVFPVKTNATTGAADEPARDQLKRYLIFQKYYTDHNTSCTITIGPDEWEEIAEMVYENWDDIVACAFLSKIEDSHPQLPYQRVTEEVYNEYAARMPDLTDLDKWVNMFEREEFLDGDLDTDATCATGACPIR